MVRNIVIRPAAGFFNLSPMAFRLQARDHYKAFLSFPTPEEFSILRYYLCARAIELALKAHHLETTRRLRVKDRFSHRIMKLYEELPDDRKLLSADERRILGEIDVLYVAKDFDYVNIQDPLTAFQRFPNIDAVSALARKLVEFDALIGSEQARTQVLLRGTDNQPG
jgi:hypothetical protein